MTTRSSRSIITTGIVLLLAGGCARQPIDLNGWDCGTPGMECVSGYVCSSENKCVHMVLPACDTGGPCPSTTPIGAACDSEGALLPCADDLTECLDGCRVCSLESGWSDCRPEMCVIGRLADCASCDDDCTTAGRVLNAEPACRSNYEGTAYLCAYAECHGGYQDADSNMGNGCECQIADEICDGRDNNCNGWKDDGINIAGCINYYLDPDGDTVGSGEPRCLCSPTDDYQVTLGGDTCEDHLTSCPQTCTSTPEALRDIPGCTDGCDSNRDLDGEGDNPLPDCVETYCGSSPTDATDACVVIADCNDARTLLGEQQTKGVHVLLGDLTCERGLTVRGAESGTTTLRQVPGTRVIARVIDYNSPFLTLAGARIVVDGLTLQAAEPTQLPTMIAITGSNNAVVRSTILGYQDQGIAISGTVETQVDGTWIVGNTISGDARGDDYTGHTAVRLTQASNTHIVGNVVVASEVDGVQLFMSSTTFVDHNTLVSRDDDSIALTQANEAINVYANDTGVNSFSSVSALCIRNNLWTGVLSNVTKVDNWSNVVWDSTSGDPAIEPATAGSACGQPIIANGVARYGNAPYAPINAAGVCNTEPCNGGVPLASFFLSTSDPVTAPTYTTEDPATPGAFCLATDSAYRGADYNLGYNFDRLDRSAAIVDPALELLLGVSGPTATQVTPGARQPGLGGCP